MPPRKPSAITNWHQTKADRQAREAGEASLIPKTPISKKPPSALKGQPYASELWRDLVGLFLKVDGTIITSFDESVLIIYCQAEAELREMLKMREEIRVLWTRHAKFLSSFKPNSNMLKNYANMLAAANMLIERFEKIDARIDGKRKMTHEIAQALFMTPRSRSGVAPREIPPEGPKTEMDKLLEDHSS